MRNAIVWAGMADPRDGTDELRAADPRGALYRTIAYEWWRMLELLKVPHVTVKAALAALEEYPAPLSDLRTAIREIATDSKGEINAIMLGKSMKALVGRRFDAPSGTIEFTRHPSRAGVMAWSARLVSGGDGGSGGGDGSATIPTTTTTDLPENGPLGGSAGDGGGSPTATRNRSDQHLRVGTVLTPTTTTTPTMGEETKEKDKEDWGGF